MYVYIYTYIYIYIYITCVYIYIYTYTYMIVLTIPRTNYCDVMLCYVILLLLSSSLVLVLSLLVYRCTVGGLLPRRDRAADVGAPQVPDVPYGRP